MLTAHPLGRRLGRRVRFRGASEVTIGRSSDCDFSIGEVHTVSREHARVSVRDGCLYLQDLGSTNGVWLNSLRLTGPPRRLAVGDEFSLGEVRFRVLPGEHAGSLLHFELASVRADLESRAVDDADPSVADAESSPDEDPDD